MNREFLLSSSSPELVIHIEANSTPARALRWHCSLSPVLALGLSPPLAPSQEGTQDDNLQSCTRRRLDNDGAADASEQQEEESRGGPPVSEVLSQIHTSLY